MSYDLKLKIILLGDSSVEKTKFLQKYVDENDSPDKTSTIGVDFRIKVIKMKDMKIQLQIWDTPGQERFYTMAKLYFKGTNGAILLYDITNRETLNI